MDGQHHLHVRKRIYKNLEPFPHPKAFIRLLDRVMVFVAVAGPAAMLPQVYDVIVTKSVESLSFTTWSLWTLLSVFWLAYGFVHKEPPLIISHGIYVALNGFVAVSIVIYG